MSLVQQRKLLLFLLLLTSLIAVFAPLMTPLHADRLGLSI